MRAPSSPFLPMAFRMSQGAAVGNEMGELDRVGVPMLEAVVAPEEVSCWA